MKRQNVSSESPYEDKIGFSRAVRCGQWLSVSGTAPIKPDGTTAGIGDVYQQTHYCLQIIETAIIAAGGQLSDVVRTRVMLTDITRWRDAGKAHADYFKEIKPACTFIEVKGLINKEWLVEIEADCVVAG
jgi:enamine deaminase RidA (YjgF/YER057c/UK114 family)